VECKDLEFDLADNGIIALQTAFASANTALKGEGENLIVALTTNPYKILGIELPKIEEGEKANITLFTASGETSLTEKNILSKSKNSPFVGKTLQGKVIGTVNNNKGYWN